MNLLKNIMYDKVKLSSSSTAEKTNPDLIKTESKGEIQETGAVSVRE